MITNNRLWNSENPYQGKYTKALVICSAGLLRSPTIANILTKEPYNFNCRAVGCDRAYALIPIDAVLVHWADIIVFVNYASLKTTEMFLGDHIKNKSIITLDIDDDFCYNDQKLIRIAKQELDIKLKNIGFNTNTGKFE